MIQVVGSGTADTGGVGGGGVGPLDPPGPVGMNGGKKGGGGVVGVGVKLCGARVGMGSSNTGENSGSCDASAKGRICGRSRMLASTRSLGTTGPEAIFAPDSLSRVDARTRSFLVLLNLASPRGPGDLWSRTAKGSFSAAAIAVPAALLRSMTEKPFCSARRKEGGTARTVTNDRACFQFIS